VQVLVAKGGNSATFAILRRYAPPNQMLVAKGGNSATFAILRRYAPPNQMLVARAQPHTARKAPPNQGFPRNDIHTYRHKYRHDHDPSDS